MTVETPENVSKNEAVNVSPENNMNNTEGSGFGEGPMGEPEKPAQKVPSPAQELRDIQVLLVSGIFPGNMAPAVCKAYNLLENMAKAVETAKPQETK